MVLVVGFEQTTTCM